MKKDKKWLKEEVFELYPKYGAMYVSPDYETVAKTETISKVLELIDQLDESELAQDQVDKYLHERNLVAMDATMVHQTGMQNKMVVEKPVIPQFVADCIEEERAKIIDWHTEIPERFFLILGYKLHYTALANTNVGDWVFDGNEEKLYQALKYGYKVEKEKKYRVRAGNRYVRFNLDGSIIGVKKDNSIVCLERLTKLPFDYKKAVESGIITLEEVTE